MPFVKGQGIEITQGKDFFKESKEIIYTACEKFNLDLGLGLKVSGCAFAHFSFLCTSPGPLRHRILFLLYV